MTRPDLVLQGYHDVSLTMLYVLGERRAATIMSRLCHAHLASHIRENLDETSQQMKLIVPLVSQVRCDLILRIHTIQYYSTT